MKRRCPVQALWIVLLLLPRLVPAGEVSPPKAVSLAVYDTGVAFVTETRSVSVAKGENDLVFSGLPAALDAATISFYSPSARDGLTILEQKFANELASPEALLRSRAGRPVEVVTAAGRVSGTLVGGPGLSGSRDAPLAVQVGADGGGLAVFDNPAAISEIRFPLPGGEGPALSPTLRWRAEAAQEGPQTLRLSYMTAGLGWEGHYEAVVLPDGASVFLTGRAAVRNNTGASFADARVKLVSTEKGGLPPVFAERSAAAVSPALGYAYGASEPDFERVLAGSGAMAAYDLPRPLTLGPGDTLYIQFVRAEKVPITRIFVYDGVRFDRFQRNRRNDWNYGTEHKKTVDSYVEFVNDAAAGLGAALPRGRFRLYEQGADGALTLAGETAMPEADPGASVRVLMGPARGLRGERERTGYSEITPLREYEESFEIRLSNDSAQEVEIRVVEHLYRGEQFEIVKADTDYQPAGPQTIEFRPVLKPGGKRSVHYTVRYRW